jgi:hypothetical protein
MNIIQMQDRLKDLSDNQLRTYVENPRNMQGSGVGQGGTSGGYVPTFLVLGEIKRRKDSRSKYEGEKAQQKTTVADDLVKEQGIGGNQMTRNPMSQPTAGVGTPQPQEPVNPAMLASKGIGQLNPGAVKQMNDGGIVGYAAGDLVRKTQAENAQLNYGMSPYSSSFADPIRRQPFRQPDLELLREKKSLINDLEGQIAGVEAQPNTIDKFDTLKKLSRQLKVAETTPIKGGGYEQGDETLFTSTLIEDVVEPDGSSEVFKEQIEDVSKVEPIPNKSQENSNEGMAGYIGEGDLAADMLNKNAYESVYGKDEPIEQMSQEDFMKELTGEGSAFAKQQKTTKEFKEDLLKRADDKIMSTDEILMNVGFNMMADKGGETNALRSLIGSGGRAALDTVKKVKAGEKEGDALRDKANQLEMNMNAAETELATKALQFGVNSKQFAEKSRQFGLSLTQAREIANDKIASAEKVARIGAAAKVKSAGITAQNDRKTAADAAVNKWSTNSGNLSKVSNSLSFVNTPKEKLMKDGKLNENAKTMYNSGIAYINAVETIYSQAGLTPNNNPLYVKLKEKFKELEGGGSSVTYQVVEQEGKKYKVGSDGSSELIN